MGRIYLESSKHTYQADVSDEAVFEILQTVLQIVENKSTPPKQEKQKTIPTTKPIVGMELPSTEEVYEYIKTLPGYRHTLRAVGKRFLGFDVTPKDKDAFEKIWNRINGAKQRIQKEESGRWKFKMKGRQREYHFSKAWVGK